jgi:hypothetical protein
MFESVVKEFADQSKSGEMLGEERRIHGGPMIGTSVVTGGEKSMQLRGAAEEFHPVTGVPGA